jgi:hypothetical protein
MVASPYEPFSAVYSSPPGRKNPRFKPDGGREHALPGQRRGAAQMTVGHRPDFRQRPAEFEHPVELLPVAQLAPPVVVPVLAAACRVSAHCLDVAVWIGADDIRLPTPEG